MPEANNFVAVDWRSGKDRCYFFFKDTTTYTRFNNADDRVPPGYPKPIGSHWGDFNKHVQNLRFGFATTRLITADKVEFDADILWLFYYDGDTPMFCEYDQDADGIRGYHTVAGSRWSMLLPYFDRIIAGTWWKAPRKFSNSHTLRFLLNDGNYLDLNGNTGEIKLSPINSQTWPGLEPFKHRIISAVQMNADFGDSFYYIFLSANQYLKYNIDQNRLEVGPWPFNDDYWPGLFRD